MNIAALETESKYESTLAEIERLMAAERSDLERLELLVKLVCSYEDEHYPIGSPDPIEAIKFRIEQMGLN